MLNTISGNENAVLQETEFQLVEAFLSDTGQRLVRKTYKKASRSFAIECAFLEKASGANLQHLDLPVLVDKDTHSLTMTFIEREDQTRDSILNRTWCSDDVQTLVSAVQELQSLPLPTKKFSMKQRTMGLAYPVVKILMLRASSLRQGIIRAGDYGWMMRMVVEYLQARTWIRNCTVHYDLTTLNCAFTPNGTVSILDFEFPYYQGDSLFDLCYFATIPPQSITDWTFQKELILEGMRRDQRFAAARCRLILTVCCLVRAQFFGPDSFERGQYLRSLEVLKNRNRFNECFVA